MRIRVLCLLAFSLGVCGWLLPSAGTPTASAESKVHWHKDLEAARAEARKTGKPLFVVFRCVP